VTTILNHLRSLEAFVDRNGVRLVRTTLPEFVFGQVRGDLITLRVGLSPEQQLLTLVHELTHWLAHRDARPGLHWTLCEYEAEAVEALVMTRLGLPPGLDPADLGQENPTDGLLLDSVARVIWASGLICGALGVDARRLASEPQAAVQFEAAAGEVKTLRPSFYCNAYLRPRLGHDQWQQGSLAGAGVWTGDLKLI
jgi:hypothetical protein